MKATEGNGGPPIVLHKGEVEKPAIARGAWQITPASVLHDHADGTVTFVAADAGFQITYHAVPCLIRDHDYLTVEIKADTVVTWERRT